MFSQKPTVQKIQIQDLKKCFLSNNAYHLHNNFDEKVLPIEPDAQSDALAEQLARINEQLVIKNRRAKRIWTAIAVIIAGAIVLQLLVFGMIVLFRAVMQNSQTEIVEWTEIIE